MDERLHLHYLAETEWLRRKAEDTAYYSFYFGVIVSCHVFLLCFCSFSIPNQFAVITKEFLHLELLRETEKNDGAVAK